MNSALIYIVVMALVAAVVFLLAALVFGRGEELAPLPPGASPTRLPADDVTPDDVRDLKFQQVLRGYKMTEVDWALDRLATELEQLRARVAELEAEPGVDGEPFARHDGGPGQDLDGEPAREPDGEPAREAGRETSAARGREQSELEREREHDPA